MQVHECRANKAKMAVVKTASGSVWLMVRKFGGPWQSSRQSDVETAVKLAAIEIPEPEYQPVTFQPPEKGMN